MSDMPRVNYGPNFKRNPEIDKETDEMLIKILMPFMDELIRLAKGNKGYLNVADLEGFKVEIVEGLKDADEVQSHQG